MKTTYSKSSMMGSWFRTASQSPRQTMAFRWRTVSGNASRNSGSSVSSECPLPGNTKQGGGEGAQEIATVVGDDK